MKSKWKSHNFLSPISGDSLKSMKQNEIIVIHSKKAFEIVYFLVAWVTFWNFQLSFLFADTMAPFKRYEQLSELVKKYPCLCNKQEKDFKKEEVKRRAWKEIANELDLENGKVVEQRWKNVTQKFLPKSVFFAFCFFSWRLLHRLRNKANDARSSERRLPAISLFSRNNIFF